MTIINGLICFVFPFILFNCYNFWWRETIFSLVLPFSKLRLGLQMTSSIYQHLLDFVSSSDLRKNIENLEKNSVTRLRTLINLGSEVYMQADV